MLTTTDSLGRESQIEGRVDYVTYQNGKSYVSIGGGLYSLDDVYAIEDQTYLDAVELAEELMTAIDKLPSMDNLTLESATVIGALKTIYDQMSEYQQSLVPEEYVTKLSSYVARIEELQEDLKNNGGTDGGDKDEDNTGGTTTE